MVRGICTPGLALVLICLVILPLDQAEARRQKVIERTDKPAISFIPPAYSLDVYDTPVLSGLDYTAVSPPGIRLRVIEDEPYIHLLGPTASRHAEDFHSHTSIILRSDQLDGWYEARINLRVHPGKSPDNPLTLSFDTAAYYSYTNNLLTAETRGETAYSLHEIRTPLGLTDIHDKDHNRREYLAYSAAVINPLTFGPSPISAIAETDSDTTQPTELVSTDAPDDPEAAETVFKPYQYTQGELKVLRRITRAHVLLTIEFEASNHPHALTLTENLARCIINRLDPELPVRSRLGYLAYYPEYEPFIPYFEGETPDPRTADLAERPGEGCGADPLPITGDVCPQCGDGNHWPAQPYADTEHSCILTAEAWPECSHCLLLPHQEKYRDVDQLRLLYEYGYCEQDAVRDACGSCKRCSGGCKDTCRNPCDADCPERDCDQRNHQQR